LYNHKNGLPSSLQTVTTPFVWTPST
jgi:hypothetical protein